MSTTAEIKLKTKSRTGCQECKAKRLKCDETRPGCKQCIRRRRTCPGYRRQFRWSTKYEKAIPENAGPEIPIDLGSLTEILLPSPKRAKVQIEDADSASRDTSESCLDESSGSKVMPPSPKANEQAELLKSPQGGHIDLLADAELFDSNAFPFDLDDGLGVVPFIDADTEDYCQRTMADLGHHAASVDELVTVDDTTWPIEAESRSLALQTCANQFTLPRTMSDMPSLLLRYWFSDVCTMWSAFDSEINPNRQLASATWSTSEPVNSALQYMAATCLADTSPHVKPHVLSLANQALESIGRWKTSIKPADGSSTLPADLLLAIFAVGTTLCWTDTKQLGLQLLNDARHILSDHAVFVRDMDKDSRRYLAHFQAALVYWEMLAKAIGDICPGRPPGQQSSRNKPLALPQNRTDSLVPQPCNNPETTPHPWTGISTNIHEVFGTVMELCRRSRLRNQGRSCNTMNAKMLREALNDIEQSQQITQELNDLVFVAESDSPERDNDSPTQETRDDKTPIQHFIDIAEAYRLAALVQLYLTFPEDLQPPPQFLEYGEEKSQVEVDLALELVEVLNRIPVTSGTRCIQPLLYISAAAGLKYNPTTLPGMSTESLFPTLVTPELTDQHLRIAQARRSVLNRLSVLQGSLPRRPIVVASKLAKAVWEDYDSGLAGIDGHWMDTMVRTGHWTLFG